uniref:hypothetical protein n=1 Tax=Synechococcus sp. UW106 TaxID=368495 RepID=UPI0010BE0535|nr:hypothetical protein [Synechococcus sp. UW106]
MKHSLAISLAAAIGISMIPIAVPAQPDRQLVKQFRDGFERGCNQGKTEEVSNQRRYCNCMANSFQSRYTGKELSAISQAATGLGDNGPSIVNLMMTPEARACNAKY